MSLAPESQAVAHAHPERPAAAQLARVTHRIQVRRADQSDRTCQAPRGMIFRAAPSCEDCNALHAARGTKSLGGSPRVARTDLIHGLSGIPRKRRP